MAIYKLCFQVPETHLEPVKAAVFAAGAGRTDHYDSACFQVPGQGQFRPLAGSSPHRGERDRLEVVREYRVETICHGRDVMEAAVSALRRAHPYEAPVIDVWQLESL